MLLFNFESGEFHKKLDGLEFELLTAGHPNRGPAGTTLYELYVNVAEKNGVLEIQCDHNIDLFDPETVKRWLGHYKSLLEGMASKPDQILYRELPMLGEEESGRKFSWSGMTHGWIIQRDALLHRVDRADRWNGRRMRRPWFSKAKARKHPAIELS